MTSGNRHQDLMKPVKVSIKITGLDVQSFERSDGDEEESNQIVICGDYTRDELAPENIDVEIDLTEDEPLQGVQLVEPDRKRALVKEIFTGIIAIVLLVFLLLRPNMPGSVVAAIMLAVATYYFGKLRGR